MVEVMSNNEKLNSVNEQISKVLGFGWSKAKDVTGKTLVFLNKCSDKNPKLLYSLVGGGVLVLVLLMFSMFDILDTVPVWLLYIALIALFAFAIETGYQLGRLRWLSSESAKELDESHATQTGAALGAMFTLIGFLLVFTFGMAGSKFSERRHLVIDDANAISSTFLLTFQLPEPYRSTSRNLLREYVSQRLNANKENFYEFMARSEQLQKELWAEATAVAQENPSPIVALFFQSLREMIDIHAKRIDIIMWTRIPPMLLATLVFLSILVLVLNGYWLGRAARRNYFPTALLIITYATVFLLVIDLDRPRGGLFRVSQEPMNEPSRNILGIEEN